MSRKQYLVALSNVQVEYVAACEMGKGFVCLRKLMSDLFVKPLSTTVINRDNQINIKVSKGHVFHGRTKNINIK